MSAVMRRVASIAGAILLIFVCALALFTVILPILLGAQSYTVLTGSMRPALEPGHLIAVRSTPIAEIKPGDIITFQIESGKPEVATHRVVGVGFRGDGERLLITQGDANNVADKLPVLEVQLRGVVVYAVPWLGYINIWATPAIKSVVVTVVGVLAIGWGLWMLFKDTRRRKRAIKRTTAAAASALAIATLVAFGSAVVSPSTAVAAESPLLLSTDGSTWTTGPSVALFDGSTIIVPGDSMSATLWIQNAADVPADLKITSTWREDDPAIRADTALASALGPAVIDRVPETLAPGQTARVAVHLDFDESATLRSRLGTVALDVTVTLTESITGDPSVDRPLATTGGNVPTVAIVIGAVLLGAGILSVILRLVRRNRRDQ